MKTLEITSGHATCLLPKLIHDCFPEISKTEARRLIDQGAVKIDGVKVEKQWYTCACMDVWDKVLRVGKRKFVRIVKAHE